MTLNSYRHGILEFGFLPEPKGSSKGWVSQVHGKALAWTENETPLEKPREADAIATHQTGVSVHVYTADCLPVLLGCPDDREAPIAAIHAGWRGTLKGIVSESIRELSLPKMGSVAILGPGLGPCCFEIQEDFVQAFQEGGRPIEPFLVAREGSRYFDILAFAASEEISDRIEVVDTSHFRCTRCDKSQLPSYRRNRSTNPQLRNWIRKVG